MTTTPESVRQEQSPPADHAARLYRSTSQRVVAGVCGGLGEYFAVDPIWFRIGFVVLALGGGSGILAYLIMWLVVEPRPEGQGTVSGEKSQFTGAAIVGLVFMIVGTIALVNTAAPWLGQFVWPVVFLVGGLALVVGGLNHDDRR